MKFKKYSLGLCGLAAFSLSILSCGHKAEADNIDSAQDSSEELIEIMEAEDSGIEQATDQTVDSVAANEAKTNGNTSLESRFRLSANAFTTTASGLKYKVIRKGNGRSPKATDVVLVNYEGKLLDGTVFDSSYKRGEPIEFPLNRVIPGWTEGVQLMQEGAEYEFIIPYQLAYGAEGMPPSIPPKADLIFKVELIQVK